MGGKAFGNKWTPRMPPDVYFGLRDRIRFQLLKIFKYVATPIEGPAKPDFGDIDFVVCDLQVPAESEEQLVAKIRVIVDAFDLIYTPQTRLSNVTIAWPAEAPRPVYANSPENTFAKSDDGQVIPFVQVDVQVCATKQAWEWNQFRHSHGDFWNILGAVVRPFHICADDNGLYVRVPEIEPYNRRRSKVKLTEDPKVALRFLGLPVDGPFWEGPAKTEDEVFEFIALCPMFMVFSDRDTTGDRQALSVRERRRTNARPLFNTWLEEFLPKCKSEGRFVQPRVTKDQIQKKLFATFGQDVRDEYDRRRHEFLDEKATQYWNRSIKAFVKTHSSPAMVGGFSQTEQGLVTKAYRQMLFDKDDLLSTVGILRPDYIGDVKYEWDEKRIWEFINNSLTTVKVRINELAVALKAREQRNVNACESPIKKQKLSDQ